MTEDKKPISGETAGAMASGGQSQGEAYPNEATDEESGKSEGSRQSGGSGKSGATGHGGQSKVAYHGPGQLGDEQVGAPGPNAPAKGE